MTADRHDPVALLMQVEDGLGVKIPDAHAERLRTMGDLHDYILARLQPYQSAACLTSAVFYEVRRALCDVCGAKRRSVAPHSRLEALMPEPARRECWRRLGAAVPLPMFPELRRPAWVVRTLILAAVVLVLVRVACWCWGWSATSLMAMTVLCLLAGRLASWATRPLAIRLPARCDSVGGLVRRLVAANFSPRADVVRRIDQADVWYALRWIVSNHLGVSPETLTEGTCFF